MNKSGIIWKQHWNPVTKEMTFENVGRLVKEVKSPLPKLRAHNCMVGFHTGEKRKQLKNRLREMKGIKV